MLPATATWGHASAGFSTTTRSPSSQTEDLPQQRSLLHPAALTTSQPKSDIASQEPKTTRANLTEPAPSPPSIVHTSTQRLYETGLFLPLSSLLHLHRDRQLARLSGSHQGRWILEQAGLSPIDFYLHLPASPLPSNLRFALLPRRMAPGLDDGRRDAQALHHNPPFQTQTVAYTDASILDTGTAADPPSITTLELVPIIHAIISFSQLPRTSAYTVYSDSMAAIRSLQQREIPADLREDLDMALHSLSSSSVTIRWVPGHAGIAGNELVHQLAREFHSRAPAIPWLSPPTNDEAADVAQTHILRKIQTNTLVTPARLYLFRYRSDPSCPNCPAPYANQEHCLLHCPVAYTTSFLPNPPPPSWSAWLASPQLEDQLALNYFAPRMYNAQNLFFSSCENECRLLVALRSSHSRLFRWVASPPLELQVGRAPQRYPPKFAPIKFGSSGSAIWRKIIANLRRSAAANPTSISNFRAPLRTVTRRMKCKENLKPRPETV
ncbi:hypothetical protein HPB47_003036 [Ixodes persulcatus]|uniref:Uncharacterized protein n=1 Tax=Ixodes persulcatus TaxID=34615 RepID=A0AC60PKK3_IXOPE|nr:hypothetical protein HPB47_003036 [Ixodes persulcatus]